MINKINSFGQINFRAKLDISAIKEQKKRWRNIAEIFETKTAKYPAEKCILSGSFRKGLCLNLLNKQNYVQCECAFTRKASNKLQNYSNVTIAEKLKSVFKILKNEQDITENADKLAKKLNLDSETAPQNAALSFWSFIADMTVYNKEQVLNKDKFLKNGLKYI